MNRGSKQVLTEWLVLSAQRGDEAAFRDLHDLWREDLKRLCLVRMQQPDAVAEVVNETWLAIARGLGRLDDPATFPSWAFRILHRRCADWIRLRMRDRRRESTAAAAADQLAPASLGPAEASDELERLRAAITELAAQERELLHLFYEQARSVAEIALVLEVPAGTVKSRLFSLRETLRRHLERKSP